MGPVSSTPPPVPPDGATLEGPLAVERVGGDEEVARLLRRPESLRCVYQPVVDLRTGEQAGYEALTRIADWPARSPQPWFAAAARSGLAGQLEAASLVNALRGRVELGPEQFLAVNVVAPFLDDPHVLGVLREQKDLGGIVVELSWPEGTSAADSAPSSEVAALRVEGLRIACDVAEAGRAELERLDRIKPDLVKLEAALVKGAHADPVRARLIRLVVSMASGMGAVVQAEGVESLDDARYMQEVGVRLAQGWLFGRGRPSLLPPPPEVATWLRATWAETVSQTRTGRLARPVPTAREDDIAGAERLDESDHGTGTGTGTGGWTARLDDQGRLLALIGADGAEVPASRLLRLRAAQDLRAAALRVLASGVDRRLAGPLVIADESGAFVGITDVDTVMREVLAEVNAG